MVSKAQQEQQEKDTAAALEVLSTRRLLQQIANRVDRVGAMVDATIADQTFTTLANVNAKQTTPVIYVDPVTTKGFLPLK